MRHIAYIGIGSNLSDPFRQCEKAISEILKVDCHKLLAKSSFYKTEPLGYALQDWFVNGVVKIETDLEPLSLLQSLKTIEGQLGRKETFRSGPRVIDLDILFFNEMCIETPELRVPHPRIQERKFVLVPLAEIDANLFHPVFKKTIRDLLNELRETQGIEKIVPSH